MSDRLVASFFFFNDTATTEIYTLSLHDALPIWRVDDDVAVGHDGEHGFFLVRVKREAEVLDVSKEAAQDRSEEHTSELQSQSNLVCRLLLEKKKKTTKTNTSLNISTYHQASRRR